VAKLAAALLVLLGMSDLALFLLAGGAAPLFADLAALPPALRELAASAAWVALGAAALTGGVLALGRSGDETQAYALREVALLLSGLLGLALCLALVTGAARGWSTPTLAALLLGAATETLIALGLTLRLALARDRRPWLFAPGAALGVGLALFHALTLLLGGP